MRIAVDDNVTAGVEAFRQFGDVVTFSGRDVRRGDLRDIDALIVRSVTRVDASLLDSTPVKFVGTATIGTDHLDLDYLKERDITVADAAGCNSRSVAEYVVASLFELQRSGRVRLGGASIGVVGAGRIGTVVAGFARSLGMTVALHDPPRAQRDSAFTSTSLEELLACDVITLHVPLTVDDEYPTRHLIDISFLERMNSRSILINTSRGGVVHREDLVNALRRKLIQTAVIDVWEGEPDIPPDLVGMCAIATPHIAGYSLEGKLRGTEMVADELAKFLGTTSQWSYADHLGGSAGTIRCADVDVGLAVAQRAAREAYDICRDDADLRRSLNVDGAGRAANFDSLRREYRHRREFRAFTVGVRRLDDGGVARSLGFGVTVLP